MVLESSRDRTDETDSDASEASHSRPRGPVLYGIDGVKWFLRTVDITHEKFEALPRWSRVGFGVLVFLFSIYFGETVRVGIDLVVQTFVVPLLGDFVRIRFGIWVVLFLLVLVMIQTSLINYRLIMMDGKPRGEQMPSDDVAPDGGEMYARAGKTSSIGSSGAGVLGGAATGAVIGASFGPAGVFGGAVLGAIVGDEIEKSSTRSRARKAVKSDVLRTLIAQEVVEPDRISLDSVERTLPHHDEAVVREVTLEMASDPMAPLVEDGQAVQLTTLSEAKSHLQRLREDS